MEAEFAGALYMTTTALILFKSYQARELYMHLYLTSSGIESRL
jgi:hypothetical protein